VGLQEAPHLQDFIQRIIWNTPNAEIPKRNFSLLSNPLVLFNRIFRGVAFIFQKDNKTDHLRDKELFTTTKPQKPAKLTIDNSRLSSNWDIGMNMRHVNNFNLWLRTLVKDITGYTLRTLFYS